MSEKELLQEKLARFARLLDSENTALLNELLDRLFPEDLPAGKIHLQTGWAEDEENPAERFGNLIIKIVSENPNSAAAEA